MVTTIVKANTHFARTSAAIALITLIGLGLRLFNLEGLGGFDFDEIVSYEFADQSLTSMLRTVAVRKFEHPPLYYALLHLWFFIPWERSESFVRLFSVVLGTLTIPAAYLLARRLVWNTRTACLTALLVAISPLEVFFSREARMYALLTLLGVLSLWLLLRALDHGRWWWVLYAVVTLLAVYTHYVALAIVLAENAYLVWVWRSRIRHVVRFLAVQLAVVLAHLPWFISASGIYATLPALGTGSWSWSYLAAILQETWFDFIVGPQGLARTRWATAVAVVVWLLALLGIGRFIRRRESLLAGALLICTLAALASLIAIDKPFQIRYLHIVHIPFLVLLAVGLERVRAWRWWLAAAVGLALVTSLPLIPYYTQYQRGDYQHITQRVELLAVDGDEVILTGPWQDRFWNFYETKGLFIHRIPLFVPPALDPQETNEAMQFIYDVHKPKRLWFVQAALAQADPTNFVERWLTENAWQGSRAAYRNGVLSLWAVEPRDMIRFVPVDMTVGDVLAVEWYEIEAQPLSGSVLRTTFRLRLLEETDKVIKLSFRLYDERGEHVQRDVFVGHPHNPTNGWNVGDTVTFQVGLATPSGAKPGAYSLGAVFYVDSEPPLPISVGGKIRSETPHILGEVELQRSTPRAVDPTVTANVVNTQFADPRSESESLVIALEGFGISSARLQPGDRLQVLLVWRALKFIDSQLRVELRLLDATGTVAWEQQRVIGDDSYRVDRWIDSDFVRDWYLFDLSPTLPEGEYTLQLRVLTPTEREGDEQVALVPMTGDERKVSLGNVHIVGRDSVSERPPLWQRALRRLWREVTK